jgi:S1-C subfamily serine protease
MHRLRYFIPLAALALCCAPAAAQSEFGKVADQVNRKMVKIFGAGVGKLASYGTGIAVSPDGYVLTVYSPLLDSTNVRVHLYDGRRVDNCKVVAIEPELDVALLKIDKVEDLPFFDIDKASQQPLAQPGDWVLAFSNQFQIAMRNEPMTVQRGTIGAVAKLDARRGVNEAPFHGDVYLVDAIMNNPGAAGGALTNRKGELLGIVGKELRSTKTDIWINYAMPIQAKVQAPNPKEPSKLETVSVADFVRKAMKGEYKAIVKEKRPEGYKHYTGIVMVPDVVKPKTPPYIEEVVKDSPAYRQGLRADDLIVYVDGELAVSVSAFNDLIGQVRPGSEVALVVSRGGKLRTVILKVEEPKK